jgi:hypothetical protein
MKKRVLLPLFLALFLLSAVSSNATAAAGDANLTRIIVVGNKINIRSGPGTDSEVLSRADAGDNFWSQANFGDTYIVDTAAATDMNGAEWYAIRRFEDGSRLAEPVYISARYAVRTIPLLSGEHTLAEVAGLSAGEVFSGALTLSVDPRDKKAQAAALLVGLPWEAKSSGAIYEAPDEESKVLHQANADRYFHLQVVGWGDGGLKGDWLKVKSAFGEPDEKDVVGWMRAQQLNTFFNRGGAYGWLHYARLFFGGSDEIVNTWGRPTSRATKKYRLFDEIDMERTVFTYPDMEITIEKDLTHGEGEYVPGFSFSRKGAGIGGFFIGEKWCDWAYIERAIGKPVTVREEDGNTILDYEPEDEHFYSVKFTLDGKGLLSKIVFDSWPAD